MAVGGCKLSAVSCELVQGAGGISKDVAEASRNTVTVPGSQPAGVCGVCIVRADGRDSVTNALPSGMPISREHCPVPDTSALADSPSLMPGSGFGADYCSIEADALCMLDTTMCLMRLKLTIDPTMTNTTITVYSSIVWPLSSSRRLLPVLSALRSMMISLGHVCGCATYVSVRLLRWYVNQNLDASTCELRSHICIFTTTAFPQ